MYNSHNNEITSNQIIRIIKLHILGDELEEPYLSIYNDLESNFGNLHKYKLNSEGSGNMHSIYFGKSSDNLIIQGFIFMDITYSYK